MQVLNQQAIETVSGGNPVIAFLTGAMFAHEDYSFPTAIAAGTIIGLAATAPYIALATMGWMAGNTAVGVAKMVACNIVGPAILSSVAGAGLVSYLQPGK